MPLCFLGSRGQPRFECRRGGRGWLADAAKNLYPSYVIAATVPDIHARDHKTREGESKGGRTHVMGAGLAALDLGLDQERGLLRELVGSGRLRAPTKYALFEKIRFFEEARVKAWCPIKNFKIGLYTLLKKKKTPQWARLGNPAVAVGYAYTT
ncbi:hypothetical protein LX36DRAFT_440903 [Colletotrichum falcatum]|nr:hypothetical protein LX36DRAFT_440903 [Colletotrichum falcatum]